MSGVRLNNARGKPLDYHRNGSMVEYQMFDDRLGSG